MSNAIHELLRADSTIYVSRTLAKAIGLNEAIIYSALLAKENYYEAREQLDDDGMFYSTADDLDDSTTLTRRQQAAAIENLVKNKLVETKLKGTPPKKHFKMKKDIKVLEELLQQGKNKDILKSRKVLSQAGNENAKIKFDKTSKSNLTSCENQIQQNVEIKFNEASKINSTECEKQIEQDVKENIVNKYNKKNREEKGEETNGVAKATLVDGNADAEEAAGENHDTAISTENADFVPYKKIMSLYHQICTGFPKITRIDGKRKKAVRSRYNTYEKIEVFIELFSKAQSSKFLRGDNKRDWHADFDWMLTATNMAKILEGKYNDDNYQSQPQKLISSSPQQKLDTLDVINSIIAEEERKYG